MKHLLWLFALLPGLAAAGTLSVSWAPPVLCSDGSPIASCAVVSYPIWAEPCTVAAPLTGPFSGSPTATAPANATAFAFPNTPAGTTWCVTVAAQSAAAGGLSAQSNVAVATVSVAPGAPAILNASGTLKTTGTAVYLASMIPGGWSFLQVGTVPQGSACVPSHGIEIYNVLDQTKVTVTWSDPTLKPLTIVAICG